jgi:hypothetical protein
MKLQFEELEDFFLHFPAEFEDDLPVVLNSIDKVGIALPLLLLLDLLDGELQHFALGLDGLAIVQQQSNVVGEFILGSA